MSFSAFASVDPCLSRTGDPKNGSRTLDVISQLLNREGRLPPSTCWLHFSHFSPGLVHGNIACSCSTCPAGVMYVLLFLAAFQMVTPSLLWCVMQNLVSPFVKHVEFLISSFLQPVEMPLSSSRPICKPRSCTDCSSQLCIVCRLAEGALPIT